MVHLKMNDIFSCFYRSLDFVNLSPILLRSLALFQQEARWLDVAGGYRLDKRYSLGKCFLIAFSVSASGKFFMSLYLTIEIIDSIEA